MRDIRSMSVFVIYRILDKCRIDGKTLYVIKKPSRSTLKIGDTLFDLYNNRFHVSAIEMYSSYFSEGCYSGRNIICISLDSENNIDVEGTILANTSAVINFIFCNNPLSSQNVDEDYKEEYFEAKKRFNCALISYEEINGDHFSIYGEEIKGIAIYRGWMLKSETYKKLYDYLESKGIHLINTPEEYKRYHEIPGWYESFKENTPHTVWTTNDTIENVLALSKNLEGSYVIKDYVKSRKHEWYDACFVYNVQNKNNLEFVAKNFIERQGKDLVGGVVLRKYEELKKTGFHEKIGLPLSLEYRVFIYGGRIISISDYWDEVNKVEISFEEYQWLERISKKVMSNFVSVDVARKEDDSLIIVEFGDGQVSGLQDMNISLFYKKFEESFSQK